MDIVLIKENMGHQSIKTTENYILYNEKRVRNFTCPLQSLLNKKVA